MLINWNKQDDQLDQAHHQISEDQRQIIIHKIQRRHAGKYVCRAQSIENPKDNDQVQIVQVVVSPSSAVTITRATGPLASPARKIVLDFRVTNQTSEVIMLSCVIRSGRENVLALDIRKMNKDIDQINYRNTNLPSDASHLYMDIDNTEDNYGTYVCTARDLNDQLHEAFTQVVGRNRRPTSILQPNPIRIDMKYRVMENTGIFELNCTIRRGHPIRSLKIIRGFGSNEELNFMHFHQEPDNSLVSAVISLTPSNVGKYYCQATNDFEQTSTELDVAKDSLGALSLNSGMTRREELFNQVVASSPQEIVKYNNYYKKIITFRILIVFFCCCY